MSVYLDNAATTPLRPEVLAEYTKCLQLLGNPSSVHSSGQQVRATLEEARESLASSIDCDRSEVIFTSGGTESDNLAIKGIYWQRYSEDSSVAEAQKDPLRKQDHERDLLSDMDLARR